MKTNIPMLAAATFAGWFIAINSALSQTWTQTNAPNTTWLSVASSADGTKLIAGTFDGAVYTSTNSGVTWTSNNVAVATWTSVGISADGTRLVAVNVSPGTIYTSTNSGMTWAQSVNAPVTNWFCVASSADGTKLVAGAGGRSWTNGPICVSTNSGATWTQSTAPIRYWTSVALSADGMKMAATDGGNSTNGGSIYISTDSGTHWAPASAPSNLPWSGIASSADGSKLVAVSLPFLVNTSPVLVPIYTSTDSGLTWVSNNVSAGGWVSVASSADGSKLVAVEEQNASNILTSTDSGATWTSSGVPDNLLNSVASSADGGKLIAVSLSGGIYTSQFIPAPWMNIASINNNLVLSWIGPSTNFMLQQNLDLTTTNWVDVTNTPALNLSNLKDEVTLPVPAGSGFYRLKTP
jgi:hypothetical protein